MRQRILLIRRALTLLAAIMLAGGLLIAGQITRRTAAPSPPGRLIDIGGRRLHLVCLGPIIPGQPTIVFEAGMGESSLTWAAIQPVVATTQRACAYDRAGYGWSDPSPAPPSAGDAVSDLRALLQRSGEPGPYVLVGHSLGGLYARLFAARHPPEVDGLLLLDPAHEEMLSQLPPDWQAHARAAQAEAVAQLRVPALLADLGIAALLPGLTSADPRLPAEAQASLHALGAAGGAGWRALASELGANEAILAEVRAAGVDNLGDLPLVVMRAGRPVDTVAPAELRPFTPTRDLFQELAAQSTRSLLITLSDSGHYVHYDAPDQVIGALMDLLATR